jgi:NAD(P)-dependent dehydrogenase (short-subunit alcohol dehydrogenase family)
VSERRLAGRVAVVTGGGGGIGRAHALALARLGAKVVVNDFGGSVDGVGSDSAAALSVVREIEATGGEAVADSGDVGSWRDAEALIATAVDRFGAMDILINNAGILRPKTIVGMTEEDFESVLRVHLFGTFATTHFVATHWRERFNLRGQTGGRLINTTSASGLFGVGQANYAAAKAGIASLTAVAAAELARYGATANAISPIALTRMSSGIAPQAFGPDHAAEVACWLASPSARDVTGQIFTVGGGHISIVERSHTGASADSATGWSVDDLDSVIPAMVASAAAHPDLMGYRPGDVRSSILPDLKLPTGDRS